MDTKKLEELKQMYEQGIINEEELKKLREKTISEMFDSTSDNENKNEKFCKFCGSKISADSVVCVACGRQVEELKQSAIGSNIIINNTNSNFSNDYPYRKRKNKWTALLLCAFLGEFGIHRFYEEKYGTGLLWMCTGGLFVVGWVIDFFILLFKPEHYYV